MFLFKKQKKLFKRHEESAAAMNTINSSKLLQVVFSQVFEIYRR